MNPHLLTSGVRGLAPDYEPETHPAPELAGLALSAAPAGGTVEVLTRAFFSSYDDDHHHYFSQILSQFPGLNDPSLDQVLVVIRENTAYVHKLFPLSINALTKTPIRPGRAVFQNQIVEVTEVRFRDSVANYPLDGEMAHRLLLVLDALVELGDRRSVALEQSPAFRRIQSP